MIERSLPEETIFAQALELASAAERAAFLDRACGGNRTLRAEVEALLRADAREGDLLDLPERPDSAINRLGAERAGSVIGSYMLVEEIGEGGMGTVWRAEQTHPVRRQVALKLVKPGMDSRRVVARFEAERQALALMDHPNIAKVHDAGTTECGRPYFVMELVRGVPITAYCDEHDLALRQRLELFLSVCHAVQHAHQKGVIHRDLKPSNVLVAVYDGTPVPKVIDFGVAKATRTDLMERTTLTQDGQLVGTLEYMSPEQACFNDADIDTRSDIYALGVLLYELLTGATPFAPERLRSVAFDETLRIIREEEPARPSARLSSLGRAGAGNPPNGAPEAKPEPSLAAIAARRRTAPADLGRLIKGDLDWIVMKALEKDRNRRYATANALATDLQRCLADEPVSACPPSARYRMGKFVRRNKSAVLAASLVVLSLVGGIIGTTWGLLRATREAKQKTAALAASVLDRALSLCQQGEEGRGLLWLVRSLELASQAGDADIEAACRWNLGAWAASVHELTLALDYPGRVHAVALSPDGRLLAAAGPNGGVRLWRTDTGAAQGGPLVHPAAVHALAFLPDGHTLLSGCADGAARWWDCRSGTPVGPALIHYRAADQPATEWPFLDGVTSVAVSPDGATAVTGGCDGTIRLWSMPDGRPLASARASTSPVFAVALSPDGSTVLSGGSEWSIRRWDARSLRSLGPPIEVGSVVSGLAFMPYGQAALVGTMQQEAVLFMLLETRRRALTLKHLGAVIAVACSSDGHLIVSGGEDKVTRMWNTLNQYRSLGPALPALGTVRSVAISRDGRLVAAGSDEGAVRLWRLAPGALRHRLEHRPWTQGIAFRPDGRDLFTGNSGGEGGEVARWDVASGRRVEPTLRHARGKGWVKGVAVSPDGAFVYTADSQGQVVHRWDAATGKELGVAGPHGDEIWRLALSPDGRRLLTGAADYKKAPEGCSARLWDATTGAPIGAPMAHAAKVHALAFSPDGRTVLTGSHDRTTRLWDAATGQPLGPPHRHDAEVTSVAFHPDGQSVLTGGSDRQAQRWDLATWRPLGPPLPHEGEVTSVGFTRDGRLIVTASADFTARLWHPETGKQVGPSLVHDARVHEAVCDRGGTMLATCSDHGAARLWALPARVSEEPAVLRRQVERRTGLSLDDNGTIRVLSPAAWRAVRAGPSADRRPATDSAELPSNTRTHRHVPR